MQSSTTNIQQLPKDSTVILAGPLVNPADYPPKMLALLPKMLEPKPGSVKAWCKVCDKEIWLGPAQQQTRALNDHALTSCFVCAVKSAHGQSVNLVAASNEGHLYDQSTSN